LLARASLGKESVKSAAPVSPKPSHVTEHSSTEPPLPEHEFTALKFPWSIAKVAVIAPSDGDGTGDGEDGRPTPARRDFTQLPWPIQAKLEVGAVDDPLEREADRVAEQVMRTPEPKASSPDDTARGSSSYLQSGSPPASDAMVQRKCSCGGSCDQCKIKKTDDEHAEVQRKPTAPQSSLADSSPWATGVAAPRIVHEVLRSPGQPLDAVTRAFFEPHFGDGLLRVRLHSNAMAERSAHELQARAYTVGNNIVFGSGQYAPATHEGRRLLAHELAHVAQQGHPEGRAAGRGNCEQHAEDSAGSVGSGNAQLVRPSGAFGTVQRQVATKSSTGPAAQKKSRLVRIERYWHSTNARAFFADGSTEEVTFVEASKLDPASPPEGEYEKEVGLTIEVASSMSIRPHVEFASHHSGSKVKVVTRLSPADRISKLPDSVRGELLEGFLSDTENESNPQMMESIADMGDRLKQTSSTTKIEVKGMDPLTVARMQVVDEWVVEQKSKLDKLSTTRRAKFTKLLSDVRRIGVTGHAKAEDLDAQEIELVLAGAAGGQSDFSTFDDFKRGMEWKLRSGNISLPEEMANNREFFIRNEYRKAWKTEASGLNRMSRIAAAAQAAPFVALGASAAVGAGLAFAEVAAPKAVSWLAGKGVSTKLLAKSVGATLLTYNTVNQFGNARDEAKAAGMNPNSLSGIVNTASAAFLRAAGPGEVVENVRDRSMVTGRELDRSTLARITGVVGGTVNSLGTFDILAPEAPNVPAAATPRPIEKPSLPENARADPALNSPSSSMVERLGADSAPIADKMAGKTTAGVTAEPQVKAPESTPVKTEPAAPESDGTKASSAIGAADLSKVKPAEIELGGNAHKLTLKRVGNKITVWLCSPPPCAELITRAEEMLTRLSRKHPARAQLEALMDDVRINASWIDADPALASAEAELTRMRNELETIVKEHPDVGNVAGEVADGAHAEPGGPVARPEDEGPTTDKRGAKQPKGAEPQQDAPISQRQKPSIDTWNKWLEKNLANDKERDAFRQWLKNEHKGLQVHEHILTEEEFIEVVREFRAGQ
jgi:hypothetical protein